MTTDDDSSRQANAPPDPTAALLRIDAICDAFEGEWLAGKRPSIAAFLSRVAKGDRRGLLVELVRMDLEYRRKAGENAALSEYSVRFPEHAATLLGADDRSESSSLGMIGPYELLEAVGSGGMGAVYRARHPKLDKIVAVKVLRGDWGDSDEVRRRFEREMKAVGRLDHPHLIRALDAGEADGAQYLAMEFATGPDAAQLLKRHGRLPIAEACELARQTALGLQAAHALKIVHRDIKPANLILTQTVLGPPLLKILDLGLAQLTDAQSTFYAGRVLGTLEFMAPEQVDYCNVVDSRADIYSLGATLYALLSGASPLAAPANATVAQKIEALSKPIRPLRDLRSETPAALAQFVQRMLARKPGDRPQTAAEAAAGLVRWSASADLKRLLEGRMNDGADAHRGPSSVWRRLPLLTRWFAVFSRSR